MIDLEVYQIVLVKTTCVRACMYWERMAGRQAGKQGLELFQRDPYICICVSFTEHKKALNAF